MDLPLVFTALMLCHSHASAHRVDTNVPGFYVKNQVDTAWQSGFESCAQVVPKGWAALAVHRISMKDTERASSDVKRKTNNSGDSKAVVQAAALELGVR